VGSIPTPGTSKPHEDIGTVRGPVYLIFESGMHSLVNDLEGMPIQKHPLHIMIPVAPLQDAELSPAEGHYSSGNIG